MAAALDLARATVEAGGAARLSFDRAVKDTPGNAARGLVVDTLRKVTGGLDVGIAGSLRFYPDGVVINRLTIGEDLTAYTMTIRLQEEGVFANPVVTPAVPPGRAMIRTSYMATHTREHLDRALEALSKVGRELKII